MFKDDLKIGKEIEREFASRLLKYDVKKIEFSEGKFPDYDIKATFIKDGKEVERTYEVKADLKVEETGNVGIEYMFNGKPSGIYTSKSNYIVYKLGDRFYYADRLRLIIELSKVNKADVIGGDNDKSQMRLVNKDVFKLLTTEI